MAREGASAYDTGYTRVNDIDDRFLQELKIKLSPDSIELEENVSYVDTGKMRADLKKTTDHPESDKRALRQRRFCCGKKYIIAELESLDKEKAVLERSFALPSSATAGWHCPPRQKEFVYHRICNLLDKISAVLCPDVRQKINPVKMLLFSVTAYVILVCPGQCLIRHIKIYPFDIAVRRCFHG